ncbi:MAG TPA: hypothetical protein DEP28_05390 [Bacteroidetes bacterium]|nr:hypothetical protein [Bacteroidota bacterium]HCN36945.1 hypothetical protein [Bacteroidota bacterium]
MKKFKIIQILSSLTKEEYKEFTEFCESYYFNRGRSYRKILVEFKKYRNRWVDLEKIELKEFYKNVYNSNEFNVQTIRNRFNELSDLAKKFFVLKELQNDKVYNDLLLLKNLYSRKLLNIFDSEYEKTEKKISGKTVKTTAISEILMLKTFELAQKNDFKNMFNQLSKAMDYKLGYAMDQLYYSALEFELQRLYNLKNTGYMLDIILKNLRSNNFIKEIEQNHQSDNLHLIINYYLFKAFSDKRGDDNFKKADRIFFKNIDKFNNEEKNEILINMISYYFSKTQQGKKEYLKDVFKLYNIKLKLGLIDEIRVLRYPSNAYRDYIVVGLQLKQFQWVKNFIEKYSSELPEQVREDEISLAYSRLHFENGEFDKTLTYTKRVNTDNNIYYFDSVRLRLMALFELTEFEEAFLELDRVKHFIKNNTKRVPLSVRKYMNFFLDNFNKILKIKLDPNKKAVDYFYHEVTTAQNLNNRVWFINKLKEMK